MEVNERKSSNIAFNQLNQEKSDGKKGIILDQEIHDYLIMDPIQKYKKYNKFPWELLFHLFLVIFTSKQVQDFSSNVHLNNQDQNEAWQQILMGSVSDNSIHTFYKVSQFQSQLQGMFSNINNFNDIGFQKVEIEENMHSFMTLFYNFPMQFAEHDLQENKNSYIYPFDLQKGIFEPFDMRNVQSIKNTLKIVEEMVLTIENIKLTQKNKFTCWDIKISYTIQSSLIIQGSLYSAVRKCGFKTKGQVEQNYQLAGISFFTNIVVFILACLSVAFSFSDILKTIQSFKRARKSNQYPVFNPQRIIKERYLTKTEAGITIQKVIDSGKPWNQLTLQEKMTFFDMWIIYTLLGNFFQIGGTLGLAMMFGSFNPGEVTYKWIIGLGCFFTWTNFIKYLLYFNKINVIMNVIQNAFPRIIFEAGGFIPILMLYIIIGMSFFSESNRFISFRISLVTLFSLLLGDSVNDITQDLKTNGISGSIGIIYTISFCFCFMLAVHNIWIAIIMEELKKKKENEEEEEANYKKYQEKQAIIIKKKGNINNNDDDFSSGDKNSEPEEVASSDVIRQQQQQEKQHIIHKDSLSLRHKQSFGREELSIQESEDEEEEKDQKRVEKPILISQFGMHQDEEDEQMLQSEQSSLIQTPINLALQKSESQMTGSESIPRFSRQHTLKEKQPGQKKLKFAKVTKSILRKQEEGEKIELQEIYDQKVEEEHISRSIEQQIKILYKQSEYLLEDAGLELLKNLGRYKISKEDQYSLRSNYNYCLDELLVQCQKIEQQTQQNIVVI